MPKKKEQRTAFKNSKKKGREKRLYSKVRDKEKNGREQDFRDTLEKFTLL